MTPDQFISLVCHDLRAPLRGLKTLPDWAREAVIEDHGTVSPALGEVLDLMASRAARMDRLVQDISAYAKLHRSELAVQTPAIEFLPDENLCRHFTMALGDVSLPMEKAHGGLILQVFMENAVKHGQADRLGGRVEIAQSNGAYQISVSDNGPGMSSEFFAKVFEPLSALQPRDVCEGSGMGLAMVDRLASLYDAEARAERNSKGGMDFHFRGPATMG